MIEKVENALTVCHLFQGWTETFIWSCLQGIMGELYAEKGDHPASAMAILGDFCFFAGRPDAHLVAYAQEISRKEFLIMVPRRPEWGLLIERQYPNRYRKVLRYAFEKNPGCFDKDRLEGLTGGLPEDCFLEMIDEKLYDKCLEISWCRDWVGQYQSYDLYKKYGLGVVLRRGEEILAGASSYSGYKGGIEIQIDTRQEERRKGFAAACGARLILECEKRGWYPSWDAHNEASAGLAKKLGYCLDYVYEAYEVWK